MTVQCLLCAEEAEFVGVGECNHEPMCFRCIYKMRVISKNNQCPICKAQLKVIIVMDAFAPFQTYKKNLIADKNFSDILYNCEAAKSAFEKLTEFKCFVKIQGKECKTKQKFTNVAFLKKHLKEAHNRYICQICVEKKTCVLQQQKLYTFKALNKHLQKGDIDEFGNVTFLHPYCKFCNIHFFDQDEFRRHINLQHMICNVCGKQEKYRYYKNYDSLQVHYKISHYICSEDYCLGRKFIAFKNAEELRVHKLQVHDKNGLKKIDIKELCGFQYEGHNPDDEFIVIKDKEGVDMEDQFLNLKKCKNKALGEADQQSDCILDVRTFYETKLEEDQHFEQAFILKHSIKKDREEERPQTQQKKRKYVQKTELQKQKPLIAKENEYFTIEEIELIHTLHGSRLSFQDFQSKLKSILREQEISKFSSTKQKLHKKQIKVQDFVAEFFQLMKTVSLKNAYLIFPHYIRTVQNEDLKEEMDLQYIKILKKLTAKQPNLILKSNNYSDLFGKLLKEIELNIQNRIRDLQLSIKKPIKKCKERLFQIVGVVRRLKIEQMAKFKFATNFGLQKQTLDYLLQHIFKKNINQIQKRISKIETEELLDLYVFVKFCHQAIKHSKHMLTEKNKIHQNILEDFLFDRPELQKQFGPKKSEMKNLEEQIEFQNLQEERKLKKQLKQMQKKNERKGFQTKTDYNLVDKGDFPELIIEKKQTSKKEETFKDVIQQVAKPATYQKKINQMFPTLGGEEEKISPSKNEQQVVEKPKPVEKAWWQKINEKKKSGQEQEQVQQEKVRVRGKKKEKWVSVKGVFN